MKLWGGPSLTGYPCEDFPSKTTRNRLLPINDGRGPKTRPQMFKTWTYEEDQQAKPLAISSATARGALHLPDILGILSGTTITRSIVGWEDLNPS